LLNILENVGKENVRNVIVGTRIAIVNSAVRKLVSPLKKFSTRDRISIVIIPKKRASKRWMESSVIVIQNLVRANFFVMY
jgi:hypothetical protein